MKKIHKKILSPFAILSFVIFAFVGILYIISKYSCSFADALNSGLCREFRIIMAFVSNHFDFSFIEVLIIFLPLVFFFVIRRAINVFPDEYLRRRFLINFVAFILLIYSGHLLALGIAHNTTDIGKKMELSEAEVTEDGLYETLNMLKCEVNALANSVPRDEDGIFDPGYSYKELSEKISASYNGLTDLYDLPKGFKSRAKGVYFSNIMSYLAISGIYTYPTGEANVNTLYPSYVTIFTAAHEMSHQRGILRENEANFIAFLITITSGDDNLRYSGMLNMYEYFASALYRTNKEAYYSINEELSPLAKIDMNAAYAVSDKYGDTIIERISDRINDLYLKSSGSSDGIISYGRVVTLVLSYYQTRE